VFYVIKDVKQPVLFGAYYIVRPPEGSAMDIISRDEAREMGLKQFYTGKNCRKGHDSPRYTRNNNCVVCKRIQYKSPEGKVKKSIHAKRYRESSSGRRYRLLESARRRAKVKGLEINIGIEDIVVPEYCPLLNIKLEPGEDHAFNLNSPSLDRIDNEKGYIKGNVAVISLKANKLKSNLSLAELEFLAENLATYLNRVRT
jgi:hypothetical protein